MVDQIKATCKTKRQAVRFAEEVLSKADNSNFWSNSFLFKQNTTQEQYAAQEVLEVIRNTTAFDYGVLRRISSQIKQVGKFFKNLRTTAFLSQKII